MHGLQSVLSVYDIVSLQNRPSPLSATSSTVSDVLSITVIVIVVVCDPAVVDHVSTLPAVLASSDEVTAGVNTVWRAGTLERHKANSQISVTALCIIDVSSFSRLAAGKLLRKNLGF